MTRWLAERYAVTGVDVSARQLELARRLVPAATFVKGDMTALDFEPETFDAVVAFHSIIHVPRDRAPGAAAGSPPLAQARRLLSRDPDRRRTWEGEDADWEGWGAAMRWSHHDGETNLAMLGDAGFEIESSGADHERAAAARPGCGFWPEREDRGVPARETRALALDDAPGYSVGAYPRRRGGTRFPPAAPEPKERSTT